MKIMIDKENDTLYVKLSAQSITESEEVRTDMIVDYDNQNRIVGIELLNISHHVSLDELASQPSEAM